MEKNGLVFALLVKQDEDTISFEGWKLHEGMSPVYWTHDVKSYLWAKNLTSINLANLFFKCSAFISLYKYYDTICGAKLHFEITSSLASLRKSSPL